MGVGLEGHGGDILVGHVAESVHTVAEGAVGEVWEGELLVWLKEMGGGGELTVSHVGCNGMVVGLYAVHLHHGDYELLMD